VTVTLHLGDCLDVMRGMPDACVDAVVTDPPYGLAFMGKHWDHGVPGVAFWVEALRVAKPGAHILAFGGTRTFHRLACAIEDAGWQIKDCLSWLYGSGFPKHKTLLKPAWEPVVMAAKAGARVVNVDACRIGNESTRRPMGLLTSKGIPGGGFGAPERLGNRPIVGVSGSDSGRWPANVCLDEEAAAVLDAQSGMSVSRIGKPRASNAPGNGYGMTHTGAEYADSGGASRFFYVAKASRSEREAGLREAFSATMGAGIGEREHRPDEPRAWVRNHHPTVKPVTLMRWLVRLVTPIGGTVLDPFMGSGTTGIACVREGRSFSGIEREESYFDIAQARIRHAEQSPGLPLGAKKRSAKDCVDLQLLPGMATSTQSQKVG
jgi:site-specific DNA-methyltransferase (adenine-specific)